MKKTRGIVWFLCNKRQSTAILSKSYDVLNVSHFIDIYMFFSSQLYVSLIMSIDLLLHCFEYPFVFGIDFMLLKYMLEVLAYVYPFL